MNREVVIEMAKSIGILIIGCVAFTIMYPLVTGRSLSFGPLGLYIVGLIAFSLGSYIRAVRKVGSARL